MRKPIITLLVCLIVCFWGAAWGAILEDDDVIIDFGSSGIWTRYNDASWAKLHPANPDLITTGDMDGNDRDDVIIDFGGSGIWVRMNNTSWAKLHPSNPESIATGDMDGNGQGDVIIDFGASGVWIWQNNTSWTKLHPSNCDAIATGDMDGNGLDEMIIDFGGSGIWVWMNNASWTKLHASNPESIATGDMDGNGLDDVIIDFGVSGIWVRMNGSSWSKLHSADPDSMATGDMDGNGQDEVIIDFGSSGTWIRYNDTAWTKLHPASPGGIATGDMDGNDHDEVILDFGASGLWVRYNDMSWAKLHSANCELITTGNIDRNRPTNIVLARGDIRLKDDASGSKSYYFRIAVKDTDGSIITESNRITEVEIFPYQSIAEIPQSDSWVFWYSPEYYTDSDGNGPNLPYWRPWSEVHGHLDVPVGLLDEGFYRGVVTDTSNQKHAIWLYYEVPTETNKIDGSSMNVSDTGDGTLRFSWTNPLGIDPSKHNVQFLVSTIWDSGDGFDDRLLSVSLGATGNAYTMPAEEVARIMGYPGLYWRVRVRESVRNIVDPDSTSKNYEVYRNYSPKQMFPSLGFTSEMLAGKVFRPVGEPGEVDLIKFSADGTGTEYDSFDDGQGDAFFEMSTLIWSIDGNGRLILELPDYNSGGVVTLLANTATYLDVQFDDGIYPPENDRLTKVIPFNAATLPGTYSDDTGATIIIVAGGTGSHTDIDGTVNFTWSVDPEGALNVAHPQGVNTEYLLASSTTNSLDTVFIGFENGILVEVGGGTMIRQ